MQYIAKHKELHKQYLSSGKMIKINTSGNLRNSAQIDRQNNMDMKVKSEDVYPY